jgi:hypothetical protein
MRTKFRSEEMKRRVHSADTGVDVKLEWILGK